jgi:DNA processing protein
MAGDEKRSLLGLWCTPHVGAVVISRVQRAVGDLAAIADLNVRQWLPDVRLPDAVRLSLLQLETLGALADETKRRADRAGISLSFIGEPTFPRGLDDVSGAPPVLFFRGRGDRPNGRRRLAMVGSRHFEHGFRVPCETLARRVAMRLIIVSGGAEGIDQLCHRAAIAVGGETWAFMGGGLDALDPSQVQISAEILQAGGTVFSEFPPGVRAERGKFPRRNRLISGASDAVLIARGARKSGTQHTVRYAREQGRPLLAVPGPIDQETAWYPNWLIRQQQATLVTDALEVFSELGLDRTLSPEPDAAAPLADVGHCSASAQKAYAALTRAAVDFDHLLALAQPLGSGQLAAALIELELAGLLVQRPGRLYERR